MPETTPNSSFRVVLGVGLVALGALFTLSNLGYGMAEDFLRWWPLLLVLYGLLRMLGIGCRRRLVTGLVYVLGGSWWLLHNLGVLPFGVWQLWPLIFIFMGIGVMRRSSWGRTIPGIGYIGVTRLRRSRLRTLDADDVSGTSDPADAEGSPRTGATGGDAGAGDTGMGDDVGRSGFRRMHVGTRAVDEEGVLRVDVFLSTVSRRVVSQQFKGGEVVAVMGGGELDMREAKLAAASARLEMNLIMGGITLRVPDDWAVEFQGTPIMGGVEDQTRRVAGEPKARLVVTGVLLLSGIVLKN